MFERCPPVHTLLEGPKTWSVFVISVCHRRFHGQKNVLSGTLVSVIRGATGGGGCFCYLEVTSFENIQS